MFQACCSAPGAFAPKIALIGAGNVGGNLGIRLSNAGFPVRFGVRKEGELKSLLAACAKDASSGSPADAAYARGVRARTKLTQAEFAARISVPIETVRNWEQGKRSPRY